MQETQTAAGVGTGPALGRVVVDGWRNCYGDGWKGTITDSSFSHPAKFAKGLIFRIVQHALDEGFLKPGDTALDCFGGVGLGGLPCALQGIQHIAVELEPRFVALATGFDCGGASAKHECCPVTEAKGLFGHGPHHVEGNLELWHRLYGAQPQWVQPTVLQGDSRFLGEVLREASCVVASPPYIGGGHHNGQMDSYGGVAGRRTTGCGTTKEQYGYGTTQGQLEALPPGSVDACLSSPPHCHGLGKEHTYADHAKREKDSHRGIMREKGIADPFYGDNPAQMGNMPADTVEACIASPPFSGTEQPCASQSRGLKDYHAFTRGNGTKRDATHTGETPGQLSAMATGEVAACVSSPPYANGCTHTGGTDPAPEHIQGGEMRYVAYSASETNLGNAEPTTFWEASKVILEQVYALLRPGGVAIWVVKSYIRDRQIVDFPGQWRRLAEHCGFVTLHEHHALLVDSHSEMGLFGEEVEMYRKSSKSFFRRLAEQKGSPEINHETVFCMRKGWDGMPPDEAWRQLPLVDGAVSSPPYNLPMSQDYNGTKGGKRGTAPSEAGAFVRYGNSVGQLEGLAPGDFEAVVSSPPFLGARAGTTMSHPTNGGGPCAERVRSVGTDGDCMGNTPGQLGAMSPGDIAAVIASPPYAESAVGYCEGNMSGKPGGRKASALTDVNGNIKQVGYGATKGNLGSMPTGEPLGGEAGK